MPFPLFTHDNDTMLAMNRSLHGMTIERRQSTHGGEVSLCIVENGVPYRFSGSDYYELERIIRSHTNGMRGFRPSPEYSICVDDREERSSMRWAHGIDFAATELRVLAQTYGRTARTIENSFSEAQVDNSWFQTFRGAGTGRISSHVRVDKARTEPAPEPPPTFVPPPCTRCGAAIHVSPYFTKGRPCPCRGE